MTPPSKKGRRAADKTSKADRLADLSPINPRSKGTGSGAADLIKGAGAPSKTQANDIDTGIKRAVDL
jgi:hypothetical protein